MNSSIRLFTIIIFILSFSLTLVCNDFRAYYTKINSGKDFERYSRTGPYADIVVEVEDGKFVFWRGSSYLPYFENNNGKWFVDEIINRNGDGDDVRPDMVNTYSRVSIVESDENKVVIYWRYLPEFGGTNPHTGVDARKFVEEYFIIANDGSVERKIKKGTEKVDDWKDPGNVLIQTFTLTEKGIKNVYIQEPVLSRKIEKVDGSPIKHTDYIAPASWWKQLYGFNQSSANKKGSIFPRSSM